MPGLRNTTSKSLIVGTDSAEKWLEAQQSIEPEALASFKVSQENSSFFSPKTIPNSSDQISMASPALISPGDVLPGLTSSSSNGAPKKDADSSPLFEAAVHAAQSFVASKNYSQALVCFGRALRYKHQSIRRESIQTKEQFADVLFSIGEIHLLRQFLEPAKAIQAFQFCLDLRSTCLGTQNPSVVRVLHKLAEVYAVIGENQIAVDILEEALSIMLAIQVKDELLVDIWNALGKQLELLGEGEDAKTCFEEAEAVHDATGMPCSDSERCAPVMRNQV